jgi:serine/threonine protein kinase
MFKPERFGRYLIVDLIATGGMAEIFKAKLIGVMGFEKTVVIKRILPFWSERRDFVTMLVDEAKILVHLNHPNIVQVFELGCEEDAYYIAMEYVEGIDLRQLMKRCWQRGGPIPEDLALFIVREALGGLHYAHQRSLKEQGPLHIVHRDVSPQNILLSFDGEVKVTDFGIAKALIQTHETQTGVLKGKFAYMSPEQAEGGNLDARSDLFSAAVVLYELLFSRRLFAAGNDVAILDRVRRAEIPWPTEGTKWIDPQVVEVLKRALALKPQERFATGEEFRQALAQAHPEGSLRGRAALAEFLGGLYAEEIQDRRRKDEQVTLRTESFLRQTRVSPATEGSTVSHSVPTTVSREGRFSPGWKRWGWALGALAVGLIAYLGFRNLGKPELRVAEVQEQVPSVAAALVPIFPSPDPAPSPSYSPLPSPQPLLSDSLPLNAVPVLKKEIPSFGSLGVNTLPWGKVSIAGLVGWTDTPVSRSRVPEGQYRVVVQGGGGKKMSATAVVRGGRHTQCTGNFTGKGTFYCK